MKGLLIKDFKLLKNQKQFYLIICVVGTAMLLTNVSPLYIVSYVTIIFCLFTVSTISYDEVDNGMEFLFTLPISRRDYVSEKYIFAVLTGGIAWLLSMAVVAVFTVFKHPETDLLQMVLTSAIYLLMMLIFLSITLPIQIKFGSEKGRIAMIATIVILLVIGYLTIKVLNILNIDVAGILDRLSTVGLAGAVGMAAGGSILVFLISYLISVQILTKRQI